MNRIHAADNFIGSLGVEVYRVGGSVRDEIIGKQPKDADYIVRGLPIDKLGTLLRSSGCKVAPLVARDKAWLGWFVSIPKVGRVEIVLPRTERGTGVGRGMEINVDHTLSLAEDAKRRDFTFNALYKGVGPDYPESAAEGGVIDPTGEGLYDLQHRIVRVTHANSFVDDPLRMLRALRFISTLDADLALDTRFLMSLDADKVHGLMSEKHTVTIRKLCKCGPGCSHERTVEKGGGTSGTVFDEFSKLLMGQAPGKALHIARDTGVLAVAMPELAPMLGHEAGSRYHDLNTDDHTFKALDIAATVEAPLMVRWALLFHDSGKPIAEWTGEDDRKHYYAQTGAKAADGAPTLDHEVVSAELWRKAASRMNVPKAMRKDVGTIIENHMVPTQTRAPGPRVRRMRVNFGDELLQALFMHRMCDLSAKDHKVSQNHLQHIAKLETIRREAAKDGVPASVKDLEVGGKDALSLGIPGRWIGGSLQVILDDVVCDPSKLKLSREWQMKQLENRVNWAQRMEANLGRG